MYSQFKILPFSGPVFHIFPLTDTLVQTLVVISCLESIVGWFGFGRQSADEFGKERERDVFLRFSIYFHLQDRK